MTAPSFLRHFALILLLSLSHGAALADANNCCKPQDQGCLNPYQGHRVALITGVNKYSGTTTGFDDRLNDLTNANRDAATIAGILREQHYNVRCLIDPTFDEFIAELTVLKTYLATLPTSGDELGGDTVIVHFSGHGFRVGVADFIFLSGDYPKEKSRDNAMRIDELVGEFSPFGNLTIDFVVDACRNSAMGQPSWMGGAFGPATDYGPKKNVSHGLIFSTSASHLAHDVSVDIGAKENGAFVFVAKKYLDLPFIDVELVYRLVRDDPDMQKVDQTPDIVTAANYFATPLAGPDFDCAYASSAVQRFGACARAPAVGPSCSTACTAFNQYLKFESSRSFCPRGSIDGLFPATRSCPPLDATASVSAVVGTIPVAAAIPTADIARLRKEAQLVSAQVRSSSIPFGPVQPSRKPSSLSSGTVRDLIGLTQTLNDDVTPRGRVAAVAQASDIRAQILKATREAAGPQGGFSELASSSLKAPSGPIELQLVPGAGGGTTGPIQPTGAPKVDCVTQYCDPNWVMVRVPTANGTIDGWIDSTKVAPAPAVETVRISFLEDRINLSRDSISDIQRVINFAKTQPKSSIKITAVTKPADDDRIRAGQLAVWTQSLIERQDISPERISTRIIELQDTSGHAPVTVELLN